VWIQEFHRHFGEITEEHTGKRQDLAKVADEVAGCRSKTDVGPQGLRAIEESSAWDYPNWWPKLSPNLEPPVRVPPNLRDASAKRQIVEALQERLRHIEVVSVLLRFVWPEEFGILSPPVAALIALPYQKDHVQHYLRYVQVLKDFTRQYEGLPKVADVDMALWAAAHGGHYPSLVDEMYEDAFFQQVRLANLMDGLGRHWQHTNRQRMLLALNFLQTDYEISAVVVARVYETLIHEIAGPLSPPLSIHTTGGLVRWLARQRKIKGLDANRENLKLWWRLRRKAIHENITKAEARQFLDGVGLLATAFERTALGDHGGDA